MRNKVEYDLRYTADGIEENRFRGCDAFFLIVATIICIIFSSICFSHYFGKDGNTVKLTDENYKSYLVIKPEEKEKANYYINDITISVVSQGFIYEFNIDDFRFEYTLRVYEYDPINQITILSKTLFGEYNTPFNSKKTSLNSLVIINDYTAYNKLLRFDMDIKNVSGTLTKWRSR